MKSVWVEANFSSAEMNICSDRGITAEVVLGFLSRKQVSIFISGVYVGQTKSVPQLSQASLGKHCYANQ